MDNNTDTFYKFYQKKSDTVIFDSYFELEKKLKEAKISEQQLELTNRFAAIQKVIQERNLDINKIEKPSSAFDDYIKGGFKSLLIGVALFGGSIGLMNFFEGNFVFYIAMIIGGFKFLQGIIELGIGLFVRVNQANKF